jgi:hypothetical protein
MDAKTEARMTMVSEVITLLWKDVHRLILKYVTSGKVKNIIVNMVFHINMEFKRKFEFQRPAVKRNKETMFKLNEMLFAWFK